MTTNRKHETYRNHDLISAFFKGEFGGRVIQRGKTLLEISGGGIDENLVKLRAFVDQRMAELTASDAPPPKVEAYVAAFRHILPRLSEGHRAMLKAHFHAPGRIITATQLARAAGYHGHGAANLQYGFVGRYLFEALPTPLESRKDGTPIYTMALATGVDRQGEEHEWRWQMRPEVAAAVRLLGLTL